MARFRPWKEMPRIFSSSAATFFRRSMVRGSVGADRISRLLATLVLAIGSSVVPSRAARLDRESCATTLGLSFLLADYRLISGVTTRTRKEAAGWQMATDN